MDVVGLETWQQRVPLMAQGYHQTLMEQVAALRETTTVYPPADQVFSALTLTPFEAVQVVIVGQDPYHGPGQAHGLAFSVPEGVRTPPSLRNIFKEIRDDVYDDDVYDDDVYDDDVYDDDVYGGEPRTFSSDLTRWAEQGVLLLNAALTVEAGEAGSHRRLGWHRLTDQIIAQVSEQHEHRVFMLWGRHAQSKRQFIDGERHLVLEAAHPSPFSAHRGFFGCRHFSQANAYLAQHGGTPIDW